MEKLTKKERRKMDLDRHYAALVRLAEACGVKKADGKKLSVALLKIEREAHQAATAYCNGETYREFNFNADENAWDNFTEGIEKRVQALFSGKLPYFFVNGDARGYALKLDNEQQAGIKSDGKAQEFIRTIGLQTDWGGYGLLAPEITGD